MINFAEHVSKELKPEVFLVSFFITSAFWLQYSVVDQALTLTVELLHQFQGCYFDTFMASQFDHLQQIASLARIENLWS